VWVLELSSYQLEITYSLACDVAILTNLTPDHLERHGSMAGYAAAKARLFAQSPAATAIIGRAAQAAFAPAPAAAIIIEDVALPGDPADWPGLAGPHNLLNARAAVAAARALGIADAVIAAGLASYRALPHRMEPVGRARGLAWVNDSKATNPDSTAPALAAWPAQGGRPCLHWIAGGRAKRDADGRIDLSALAPHLGNVARAYLIGEAAAEFAATLAGAVPVTMSGTIGQAVADVLHTALPGDVVLFSPAAASFDQFSDYEARGRAFAALVEGLGA
jgi:UDP-N-acetylmuramoylalanine--D-glutamate ligase